MTLDWIAPAGRLSALPPYVFARLDELKARAREQGLDLIDLGMGNPDGPTPQPVVEAAIAALQNSANHGYPPFEGTASFRKAIASWYHRRYAVNLDPDSEALPLLGSKEGLTHLALAYVNPGDLVLVPSPSYPAHFRGPLIAGGIIHSLILKPGNDWLIDLAAIPDAVAEEAKILYFNYPSNPTTATAPREFLKILLPLPVATPFCSCMISVTPNSPLTVISRPACLKFLGLRTLALSFTPYQKLTTWQAGASVLLWGIAILFKGYGL